MSAERPKSGEDKLNSARYPTVPFLISRRYCREVAKGAGLKDEEAPLTGDIWWHFGGQAMEKMLCLARPDVFAQVVLKGIAIRIRGEMLSLSSLFPNQDHIIKGLALVVGSSRSRYSRSPYDDFLSESLFAETAIESLQPRDMLEFLHSRQISQISLASTAGTRLALLIS
jgi:hypothetical protein